MSEMTREHLEAVRIYAQGAVFREATAAADECNERQLQEAYGLLVEVAAMIEAKLEEK